MATKIIEIELLIKLLIKLLIIRVIDVSLQISPQ